MHSLLCPKPSMIVERRRRSGLNIILTRGSIPQKKYVIGHLCECIELMHEYTCRDYGVICFEFGNDIKTCDEVVTFLKYQVRHNGKDLNCYPYFFAKAEVWGESEMLANEHMLRIRGWILNHLMMNLVMEN